ncbi:hypothetical protein [Haloarchaeobius sp. FL176]|uniref:hypothetical protein n=1 Tax=Haloarchaeobius sp. FL176 TaxID=2967129 RepID=UPI00214991D5|nr:hypothetical protein [Haloarchaeobius sp. FL176]
MRRQRAASLVSVGLLGLGTWLPWLRLRPGREVFLPVYVPGLGSGLEYFGFPLLVWSVLVGVGLFARPDSQFTTTAAVITGCAGSLAVAVEFSSLLGSQYAPAAGLYLTALGSTLLVVSRGCRALVTSDERKTQ